MHTNQSHSNRFKSQEPLTQMPKSPTMAMPPINTIYIRSLSSYMYKSITSYSIQSSETLIQTPKSPATATPPIEKLKSKKAESTKNVWFVLRISTTRGTILDGMDSKSIQVFMVREWLSPDHVPVKQ